MLTDCQQLACVTLIMFKFGAYKKGRTCLYSYVGNKCRRFEQTLWLMFELCFVCNTGR
jgi:hypothetical protein